MKKLFLFLLSISVSVFAVVSFSLFLPTKALADNCGYQGWDTQCFTVVSLYEDTNDSTQFSIKIADLTGPSEPLSDINNIELQTQPDQGYITFAVNCDNSGNCEVLGVNNAGNGWPGMSEGSSLNVYATDNNGNNYGSETYTWPSGNVISIGGGGPSGGFFVPTATPTPCGYYSGGATPTPGPTPNCGGGVLGYAVDPTAQATANNGVSGLGGGLISEVETILPIVLIFIITYMAIRMGWDFVRYIFNIGGAQDNVDGLSNSDAPSGFEENGDPIGEHWSESAGGIDQHITDEGGSSFYDRED